MAGGDSATQMIGEPDGRRRRGRPPRIRKDQIVAVASTFEADVLTMQAVADELGVDRTAIHYHVSSRDDLLELVAADIFRGHIERVVVAVDGDWRDDLRAYALGMHDALVATGSFAPYVNLPPGRLLGALEPVERVLESLVRAGFEDLDAARTLEFVSGVAVISARRRMINESAGTAPEMVELEHVLDRLRVDEFPVLRRVVATAAHIENWTLRLLDFDLDVVIAGLEQLLAGARGKRARPGSAPGDPTD